MPLKVDNSFLDPFIGGKPKNMKKRESDRVVNKPFIINMGSLSTPKKINDI